MKRTVLILIASFSTLAWFGGSAHAQKPSLGVLGLELVDDGSGVTKDQTKLAGDVTNALRNRAKMDGGPYRLGANTETDLVDVKLISGCDDEKPACMAGAAADMKVDALMWGKLMKATGGGFQVSLSMLTVSSKAMRHTTRVIPANETGAADVNRWAKTLYASLTGGDLKGALVVVANASSGSVFIDKRPAGTLTNGTATITDLPEGRYTLSIEADGFAPSEQIVTVNNGENTDITVTLNRRATKPNLEPNGGNVVGPKRTTEGTVSDGGGSTGWKVAAITSGLVAAGGGGLLYYSGSKVTEAKDMLGGSGPFPCDGNVTAGDQPWCDQGKKYEKLSYVGGATVAVAGGFMLFAIYKGFIADSGERPVQTAGRRAKKPAVAVTPVIAPSGVGATVQIDF